MVLGVNTDTSIEKLMRLGERLHFLSDVLGPVIEAATGVKPKETGPATAKAAWYFFGLGKEEERRMGKKIRAYAESNPDDAQIFVETCEWLFTPTDDSVGQWVEAALARNALFVYIAKVDELTAQREKIGTETTTSSWTEPDPNRPGKTRKMRHSKTEDRFRDGGDSEGIALIDEIVQGIKAERAELPPRKSAHGEKVQMDIARRRVITRLQHARGIPIRKVGDPDFTGWLAALLGLPKVVVSSIWNTLINTVSPTPEQVQAAQDRRQQELLAQQNHGWIGRLHSKIIRSL